MKRKWITLAVIVAIIFGCGAVVYAAADGGLFDDLDNVGQHISFLQYRDNYYLDTKKVSFFKDPLGVMFLSMANLLFALQKGMGELMVSLLNFAITCDLFSILKDFLEPFFGGMKEYVFNAFSLLAISLSGFFYVLKLVKKRHIQIITGLLQVVLILVIAGLFYAFPMQLLSGINNVTVELSGIVMDAPYNAITGTSADVPVEEKATEITWNLMVHKPWQLLEFGSVSIAEQHEEKILLLPQGSDERQEYVDSVSADSLFSSSAGAQLERIVTSLILLLFQLVMFAVLCAFAVLIVGYQFFTLLLAFLGMFVFLLALIPHYGLELLKRWGGKILSVSAVKIALVFFMTMLFVLLSFMYSLVDQYGLLSTMFLIVVMLAITWIKRTELIDLFSGYGGRNLSEPFQTLNRTMDKEKDFNAVHKLRSPAVQTLLSDQQTIKSSSETKNDAGAQAATRTPNAARRSEESRTPDANLAAVENLARSIERTEAVTTTHYKRAEELLEKQYEASKEKSEAQAMRTGGEPEYTDFVKRTDAVRELGAGAFDQRDLTKAANLVRNVEARGGDLDSLLTPNGTDDAPDGHIQRPDKLELHKAPGKMTADQDRSAGNRQNVATSYQGVEYFRYNFGVENGERFYEKMVKSYDQDNVDRFQSTQRMSYAQVAAELKTLSAQGPLIIEPEEINGELQGDQLSAYESTSAEPGRANMHQEVDVEASKDIVSSTAKQKRTSELSSKPRAKTAAEKEKPAAIREEPHE